MAVPLPEIWVTRSPVPSCGYAYGWMAICSLCRRTVSVVLADAAEDGSN